MFKPLRNILWLLIAVSLLPVGCGPLKPPRLPEPITAPTTDVLRVDLVETSAAAGQYDILVTLINPNDFELPMPHASYQLTVAGHTYSGDAVPNATMPAQGQVNMKLPAVIHSGDLQLGQPFEVTGTAKMNPPGQIRMLMYELGIPMPTVNFSGQGTVTGPAGGVTAPAENPAENP